MGDRGQDSLTTRDAQVSFARMTEEMSVTQSWVDFSGFQAEDDGADRSYTARGLQVGAHIAATPDMVVGLSLWRAG